MEFELHHGTFRLYIDGDSERVPGSDIPRAAVNARHADYFQVTATVPVVAGSGTGAYRGISGDFSLTLTGNEDQKTPPCGSGFASQVILLTGSGTVSS